MASKRIKNDRYLKYIRELPCLVCRGAAEAHHLMHAEPSAMGLRSGDDWAVPLCREHHTDLHLFGDEPRWWAFQGVDPIEWAEETWRKYQLNMRT